MGLETLSEAPRFRFKFFFLLHCLDTFFCENMYVTVPEIFPEDYNNLYINCKAKTENKNHITLILHQQIQSK